uniref:Putative 16.8 kDa salivary protein n=1 Tax=Culex tarsalis TaxID=7177 RepID=A0A1Q3EUU7_CULTA
MIRAILMCLILVLVPVELAKLEPGCVTIKNRYNGKFLTHSNKNHDKDRRHVSLWDTSEQWILIVSGDHYRLRHRDLNEELFESEQHYNGNYVFTWIPKQSVTAGEFDIWESRPGYFYMQNVKFRHCLSSTFWKGWVGAYPKCKKNGENEWEIKNVKC